MSKKSMYTDYFLAGDDQPQTNQPNGQTGV